MTARRGRRVGALERVALERLAVGRQEETAELRGGEHGVGSERRESGVSLVEALEPSAEVIRRARRQAADRDVLAVMVPLILGRPGAVLP